jgi:glycosyltransferase
MKTTMITACLNPGSVIASAVDSVLRQTVDALEYLILDGGSNDGTLERVGDVIQNNGGEVKQVSDDERGMRLFASCGGKSIQVYQGPDSGMYDALNKGIQLATGDVIGLVHADDFLYNKNVLECVMRHFDANTEVVYGDLQYVHECPDGRTKVVRNWRSGTFKKHTLHWGWMPPHPAMFVRKDVYKRIAISNDIFYNPKYCCAGDYDLILLLFSGLQVPPVYIPEVLVRMRTGGISNGSVRQILRKSWEDFQAIRHNRIGGLHTLIGKNVRKIGQFYGTT